MNSQVKIEGKCKILSSRQMRSRGDVSTVAKAIDMSRTRFTRGLCGTEGCCTTLYQLKYRQEKMLEIVNCW